MGYIICFILGVLLMGLLEIIDILVACLLFSCYRAHNIFF